MRLALKIIGAALFLCVAAAAAAFLSAFSGNAPLVAGQQLPGGVAIVKDGFVSAAVLSLQDGSLALVDCSNDPQAAAIQAEVNRRGFPSAAVKAIFLTHGHRDHTAGCREFPNADIYAMEAERDLLEGRAGARSPLGRLLGRQKDSGIRIRAGLHDGDAVKVGDTTVKVFAMPGHTDGSAAYLIDGVVYLGDSAYSSRDGKLTPAKWIFSNDVTQNRASLDALFQRLAPFATDIHWLEFAHSAPLQGIAPLKGFSLRQQ